MQTTSNLPWISINDYLLEVGRETNPRDFCISAFNKLKSLIPFDTGMLYLLNDNLVPIEQHFIGIHQGVSEDYLTYYSKLEDGRFFYTRKNSDVYDWSQLKNCEFKNDFIDPMGITFSSHIKFFNIDRWLSACLEINRTGKCNFTPMEKRILKIIRAHLANLYRNFFVNFSSRSHKSSEFKLNKSLTPRENEIVDLLVKGMSPKQISLRKYVSLKTTYNHLSNIYEKAKVSNQRELLVKVMHNSEVKG